MSNMSYCMFQNTANDLADCLDVMYENEPEDLSDEEQNARNRIIRMAEEIVMNFKEE